MGQRAVDQNANGFDKEIDFDLGDQNVMDFHNLNREYKAQHVDLKEERRNEEDNKHWRYVNILKKKGSFQWSYKYDEDNLAQWKKFEQKYLRSDEQIITSTMLTLSGIDGLNPGTTDEERVKRVLVDDIGFDEGQIERVQIRENRFWSIIYIRAPIKVIRDKMKNLEEGNKRKRRERLANRPQNFYQKTDAERKRWTENERKRNPLYSLREFNQRPRENEIDEELKSETPNAKLYVTNFDILNRKCHKALTKLFLKFGDLKSDIYISLRFRRGNGTRLDKVGDPCAYVEYMSSAVARTLFEYQNRSGHPKEKITFGGRTLAIQLSKMNTM